MNPGHIRNFSIIAHVDHGKSTLADRLLERTGTIPPRQMRDQVLDRMDLERERGITIKMTPVRMTYHLSPTTYNLNLIDTPGHIDFSYEVSRALHAVEGVLLLVDSTQGVQAQTLTTLAAAASQGCTVIPIVSKIDSPAARPEEVAVELAELLHIPPEDVLAVSGRTGEGVDKLLEAIVERIPPPHEMAASPISRGEPRGLIFDFSYSKHRGIAVCLRVFDGTFKKGQSLRFHAAGKEFIALEVGIFAPEERPADTLSAGEIGYIVTGIKEAGIVAVGDTIGAVRGTLPPLPGYERPRPVVWASVYPSDQDDLTVLRQSLERLRLSDSSLSFEEESSGVLGRGFRCGFLGLLHLEIVTERLRREFGLSLIVTIPTISYAVTTTSGAREIIYTPAKFPEHGDIEKIEEPWAQVSIMTPFESVSALIQMLYDHEAFTTHTETHRDGRIEMKVEMPLRELMRGFFDKLKSISSGYASLSYEILPERLADVVRLDVLVALEPVPAFARVVARRRVQEEAEKMVEKLHNLLPKQLFVTKIQAKSGGRIIASRTLSAMRKDVTGYLYGGDVTRKMKLLEKQKKGKKKMLERGKGKVHIPEEVFMKMVQSSAE
ncbi:elongation factor 4 [Candidatus Kaiserbacteria bacterium RIFCSPHIGHO2_02_FULL_55_17]|uniref:Elongation factor 4 n=1 Tax=Candidatus Kaiserbacteria bacterium RIFCSPHIGHO2_02_FULL_55_17 TaxID=1798496 RepID=A0A1F6DVF8_9BACT|nr:MAG: Elongation factor 4 [Parcubacteria group bacterium GW2011_GWA2_56_21]OGG65012.1 MAG: elongation factor 4 [Candidatus Kaiserbacteria bacterium RIFCSPHIGHO2_02_FULL_55_17]